MTDLRLFPKGAIKLASSVERVQSTVDDLRRVLETGRLQPAFAGKLYGRMQWASATCFGRFGRAMLRAFSRRQHEPGRSNLNPQIYCRLPILDTQPALCPSARSSSESTEPTSRD